MSKGQAFSSYVRMFYHNGVYHGGRYTPLRLLIDCTFIAENSPCWGVVYWGGGGYYTPYAMVYLIRYSIDVFALST